MGSDLAGKVVEDDSVAAKIRWCFTDHGQWVRGKRKKSLDWPPEGRWL